MASLLYSTLWRQVRYVRICWCGVVSLGEIRHLGRHPFRMFADTSSGRDKEMLSQSRCPKCGAAGSPAADRWSSRWARKQETQKGRALAGSPLVFGLWTGAYWAGTASGGMGAPCSGPAGRVCTAGASCTGSAGCAFSAGAGVPSAGAGAAASSAGAACVSAGAAASVAGAVSSGVSGAWAASAGAAASGAGAASAAAASAAGVSGAAVSAAASGVAGAALSSTAAGAAGAAAFRGWAAASLSSACPASWGASHRWAGWARRMANRVQTSREPPGQARR